MYIFLNKGFIEQVQEERAGQVSREGFTIEHDDEHRNGELARAAAVYANPPEFRDTMVGAAVPIGWPWSVHWWKPAAIPDRPQARQRELIKAAALLYAEWERLERHIIAINERPQYTDTAEKELSDTLATAAITELEDIIDNKFSRTVNLNDPSTLESPFEKSIRETAEKNITDELRKHPATIGYAKTCPKCNGSGVIGVISTSLDLFITPTNSDTAGVLRYCEACDIEASHREVKHRPRHTCGKDGPNDDHRQLKKDLQALKQNNASNYEQRVYALAQKMANDEAFLKSILPYDMMFFMPAARMAVAGIAAAVREVIEDAYGLDACNEYLKEQGLIPDNEKEGNNNG